MTASATPPGGRMRHTRRFRCPVCDGADGDPRDVGKRCFGFTENGWVNCTREEFAGAAQRTEADTFSHRQNGPCPCGVQHGFDADASTTVREMQVTYDYTDEHGQLLFQVVRLPGKKFRQRRPDAHQEWVWSLEGVRRVPFRLRELLDADASAPVLIVEGEKDVLTAVDMGFVATCNPGGAGKWRFVEDTARAALRGRRVVVVADADDVGRKHAQDVATSLSGHATVSVLELPGHKDFTDAARAGMTAADVLAMIASADAPPVEDVPVPTSWLTDAPPARTWLLRDSRAAGAPGVLPLGKAGQVIGQGGVSKTMALVQLALAVASGTRWLNTFDVPSPGRVLMLLGEEDAEECHRRFHNAARAMGLRDLAQGRIVVRPLAGKPSSFLETGETGEPSETAYVKALRDNVRGQREPYRLIIIDPLSRFAGKDAETENSAATRFVQSVESLAALGPTVLVAHHTPKVNRGDKTTFDNITGRGSSALVDGFRWECALMHKKTDGLDSEDAERLGRTVALGFTKSNYSLMAPELMLRRSLEHGGALVPFDDQDAMIVGAAAAQRGSGRKEADAARWEAQEAFVLDLVTREPGMHRRAGIASRMAAERRGSEDQGKRAVDRMVSSGLIDYEEGPRSCMIPASRRTWDKV